MACNTRPLVRVRSKTGWHPFWVQEALSAFTRWSAPFPLADHRLPAANPPGLVSKNEIGTRPGLMDLKSLMQPWSAGLAGFKGIFRKECGFRLTHYR